MVGVVKAVVASRHDGCPIASKERNPLSLLCHPLLLFTRHKNSVDVSMTELHASSILFVCVCLSLLFLFVDLLQL